MLRFAREYGHNNSFSQFGEDGIIEEVFKRLKIKGGCVAEFGAHNGFFCSNTRDLIDRGFASVLIEGEKGLCDQIPQMHNSTVINTMVTEDNINELIPQNLVLLSIDTDNMDFWLWLAYNGKPDIVIIEINSSLPPMSLETPGKRGSSYAAMVRLGISKGYFLLCHTANCVFVLNKHRKHFPEIVGDGLENYQEYFNTSHLPK